MGEADQCLARSIAFRRLAFRLGFAPTLVLGVKLDPFAAHCWVQSEDCVANDSLERVRCFPPIFALCWPTGSSSRSAIPGERNQRLSRNTWLSWICGSSIPVPVFACSPISRMRCGGGEKRWRSAICSSETRHRCLEQTPAEFLIFAAPPSDRKSVG